MIDEKKCYFFGRNKQLCDFCIDHASSSRVHSALVWHKNLNRPFIIDLGSSKYLSISTVCSCYSKSESDSLDSSNLLEWLPEQGVTDKAVLKSEVKGQGHGDNLK